MEFFDDILIPGTALQPDTHFIKTEQACRRPHTTLHPRLITLPSFLSAIYFDLFVYTTLGLVWCFGRPRGQLVSYALPASVDYFSTYMMLFPPGRFGHGDMMVGSSYVAHRLQSTGPKPDALRSVVSSGSDLFMDQGEVCKEEWIGKNEASFTPIFLHTDARTNFEQLYVFVMSLQRFLPIFLWPYSLLPSNSGYQIQSDRGAL